VLGRSSTGVQLLVALAERLVVAVVVFAALRGNKCRNAQPSVRTRPAQRCVSRLKPLEEAAQALLFCAMSAGCCRLCLLLALHCTSFAFSRTFVNDVIGIGQVF